MPSTNQQPPKVSEYGIVYADTIFELSQLVNHQLKKGFTLYLGVDSVGDKIIQCMVKYAPPAKSIVNNKLK